MKSKYPKCRYRCVLICKWCNNGSLAVKSLSACMMGNSISITRCKQSSLMLNCCLSRYRNVWFLLEIDFRWILLKCVCMKNWEKLYFKDVLSKKDRNYIINDKKVSQKGFKRERDVIFCQIHLSKHAFRFSCEINAK